MSALDFPRIEKALGVSGGNACVVNTHIPVWLLVLQRKMGRTDLQVLSSYPTLSQADLDAAWEFFRENPLEVQQAIWLNDTAANVAEERPVPSAVVVAGRLLGISDADIRDAFDPQLSSEELAAAWEDS